MNKKEIVQKFTKQTLDQYQSRLTYQQIMILIREVEELHSKILQNSNHQYSNIKMQEQYLQILQNKVHISKELENLNNQIEATRISFMKNHKASVWYRYWTAIGVGIISSMITNLVWWLMS